MLISRAGGTTRRRHVAQAVAVVLGVGLVTGAATGCQSNPEPPPLEAATTTPSPSASASPSPVAPTLPAEAQGRSEAAAKAFVRHWVQVLNYAGPAGDPDALRAISHPDCAACSGIADFIEEVHANDGSIEGSGWQIQTLDVVAFEPGSAVIDAATHVSEQRITQSSGGASERFEGGQRLKTFWLTLEGDRWLLTRLDQPQ